jgi:aldehyde dehydrogenase (NAD+)
MNEPIGTIGMIGPSEAPFLGLLSVMLPAIAMGNTIVAIPSERYALMIGDIYQLFDTSDLPGGVVNLVTGRTSELTKVLAEHDDVDSLWCFADEASGAQVKALSVGNLKQVFSNEGRVIDWFDNQQAEGRWFLQHAVQVKNVWVPYGE